MKTIRSAASVLLLVIVAGVWMAPLAVPLHPYEAQFRRLPDAAPSTQFPLGTDALGRDRLSRLIYGARLSLTLAPAAALLSIAIAALIGAAAAHLGGIAEKLLLRTTDLFVSVPWVFLLLIVRAVLPLDVPPEISVLVTFAVLGLLGWAAPARVVWAQARSFRSSDACLLARAYGCGSFRLLLRHSLPNVRPVLMAQFWIAVPVFIIAEANLSVLGLGVAEPLPSLGNLLRDLGIGGVWITHPVVFAPLALLVTVVACFQLMLHDR